MFRDVPMVGPDAGLGEVVDRLRAENDALEERLHKLEAERPLQPHEPASC